MQELYGRIALILDEHAEINFQAMIAMQSMGYNGFKRWHRCVSKCFNCFKIELANELFDKYREKAMFKNASISYSPVTLKEHLATWDAKLDTDIKKLGMLNKEHFEEVGVENCIIKEAMCKMLYLHEKVGRYYRRFEKVDWLGHDIYVADSHLHKKMKKREAKHK